MFAKIMLKYDNWSMTILPYNTDTILVRYADINT